MINEEVCPHNIPNKQWTFREALSPMQREYRHIIVLNSESCPSCLKERIENLRKAIDLILTCIDNDASMERRRKLEDGLRLFYSDIRRWGP